MTRETLTRLLALVILISLGCSWYFVEKNKIRRESIHVGILKTARHTSLDIAEKAFVAVLTKEFSKNISFSRRSQENSITQGQLIAQQFLKERNLQLVFALGTGAALAAYSKINTIPLIFGAVDNPEMLGLIGEENLCAFSDMVDLDAHISFIKGIKPAIKSVGILFSFKESNSRSVAALMHHQLKQEGFKVVDIPLTDYHSVDRILDRYEKEFDILWIPADSGIASNIVEIAKLIAALKKPFISCDQSLVQSGAIAALGVDFYTLGERAGYAAARILRKERTPTDYGMNNRQSTLLVVNKTRCTELNLSVPEKITHSIEE